MSIINASHDFSRLFSSIYSLTVLVNVEFLIKSALMSPPQIMLSNSLLVNTLSTADRVDDKSVVSKSFTLGSVGKYVLIIKMVLLEVDKNKYAHNA